MLKWRYRNARSADTEGDQARPLYWKNEEGWVTDDDNPTEFTTDEVLRLSYPIDGYPEPRATVITFAMGVTVSVEIMDTLSAEEIQKIENEWQAVWTQAGYYPDTDEEAVHETMKNLGIQMYRILEDHLISYP